MRFKPHLMKKHGIHRGSMENSLKTQMRANEGYFDLRDKNRTSVYE